MNISCQLPVVQTEPEYRALGFFKKSDKTLKTQASEDYQDMVQELSRVNREYRESIHGFDKRTSKRLRSGAEMDLFDEGSTQERHYGVNLQRSEVGERRLNSQRLRRHKLNMQGERNHRAHAIESSRRRRLQPEPEE